jgi:Carboxypeptidase regulatory-like domain
MRLSNLLISALLLGISLPSTFAQSADKSLAPTNSSAISGRIVARSKPLPGAVITLWQGFSEPTPSTTFAIGKSDVDGVYRLTDVPPGNYFISATATGFVTGKENNTLSNLRHVVVTGTNAVDPVNFELVSEGVIKGAVTDADGKPVARVPITIIPEPAPIGDPLYARNLRTDDQGTYRVAGIPAGRYRIAAGYQSATTATIFGQVGYRRIFYPDASDEANARLIEIAAGSEVTDVNINLGRPVKTFSVNARVIDSQNGKPVEGIDYRLDVFSNGKRIGGASTKDRSNGHGEITINNVPPGEYSIAVPGNSSIFPDRVVPAPNIFGESKHFEVTNGDVGEIEVRVVRGATVSGFVVIEGAAGMNILAKMPEMHIIALVEPRPGGSNPLVRTNIKPDGSFTFTGLKPGKLTFSFDAPPAGGPLPLRLVRTERDGVRLDKAPEIEMGDQISGVRVVLGYATGSIHGVVKLDNGPLPIGVSARAVVLQNGKSVDGASTDSHGEFILQHLSAGDYTLAVFTLGVYEPELKVEQQILISDDKVSEVTMSLNSTATARPNPKPRPVAPH